MPSYSSPCTIRSLDRRLNCLSDRSFKCFKNRFYFKIPGFFEYFYLFSMGSKTFSQIFRQIISSRTVKNTYDCEDHFPAALFSKQKLPAEHNIFNSLRHLKFCTFTGSKN